MQHLATQHIRRIKTALFIAALLPLANFLLPGILYENWGTDPVAHLTGLTGFWTLNLLFLTLSVSPLRKITGWNWLVRLRRMIALFSFFYASLHVSTYLVFGHDFDWPEIIKDITKRPYIMAGLLAYLMLTPLALTSTDNMMRRLGGKRWQLLHRLTYPTAMLAVLHYLLLVKRDITEPGIYALLLCILLTARILNKKTRSNAPATTSISAPTPKPR